MFSLVSAAVPTSTATRIKPVTMTLPGDDPPQTAMAGRSAATKPPMMAHPCQAKGVQPSRSRRKRNQVGLPMCFSLSAIQDGTLDADAGLSALQELSSERP